MKLVVFGPFKRLGALLEDGSIVDLNLAYARHLKDKGQPRPEAHADLELPANLQEFIEEGETALRAARKALAYARKKRENLVVSPEGVKIWAPLPSLRTRIICAAGNFTEHSAGSQAMREGRSLTQADIAKVVEDVEVGKHPKSGFWKMPQCVIGPDEPMVYPSRATHLDYEVEIAAVMGKEGTNIPENEEAMDYVFGYTGFNDWSIRLPRDPKRTLDWAMNKNFNTAASLGPCIVTKDEMPDPYEVRLQLWLNGKLRQDARAKLMIRRFPEWIAHISRDFTLYPGDIFASGTPVGTATDSTPRPKEGPVPTDRFVKVGDVVKISLEGIGSMENKVIAG